MMKFLTLFIITFSSPLWAYTLNNNFGGSFKDNDVKVKIAGDTACSYNSEGITIYELEDIVEKAVAKFWNRVPTSALKLKSGGFTGVINNINHGRLCAPTDNTCINSAPGTVIPPVTDIVIACNDLGANFGGGAVLAVTVPNNFSGKSITGAVILINNTSTSFYRLSTDDKIGVIAHEIGHAIGLGHTDDKAALMFYRTVDQRKALGEDDIRGVSYLYPMQIDGFGLLGGCGTIQSKDGNPPTNPPYWPMVLTLVVMIAIFELHRLFKRSQARPTL